MLHVHRAERADGLVDALRDLLAAPQGDPFAREVVAVPTRGMERWLTQRLSTGLGATAGRTDGVCANVTFPSPRRLVGEAVAAASGVDPEVDPWLPERLVWPLIDIVDECVDEPWLQTLAGHLGRGGDRSRRFAALRHLADLLDRYALHRPELVRAWAQGSDGGIPPDAAWQAELWRRLHQRIGVPDPATRLAAAQERLEREPQIAALPGRFALFGLTRLPAGQLHVLRALAAARDVHLFLLHPSPVLWERITPVLDRREAPVVRRDDDRTKDLPHSPLLTSWGHDVRELQLVVGTGGEHVDHHHTVTRPNHTLLHRLQTDIAADRPPPGRCSPLDRQDQSLQVHSCHGRARQVEVLRDAILHALEDDPSLEPRDVIVMCPDVEAFAPLIQATFGAGERDETALQDQAPDLRVRLADRSLRRTNPVLGVVARLLELASERLTASQVVDLADREPVRRRFGFDDDDLARMEEWIRDSGIRWGLDAPHRAPFKLAAHPNGTWRAGLDRLLLGVTMTEEDQRLFANVLPLDDVDSGAIDLTGRLAEMVARLQQAIDALSRPQPVAAWAAALAHAADALTATPERDAWQRGELQRLLDDVVSEAADSTTELSLAEVRALLGDRLQGRPTRTNFRTGHLTVCTLVPMRSVPHRVVCLLGLDDGVFPRKTARDGDDLMLADPHVGERDPRTEDRQQLLDALMAATDRLIITYTGNDERTNLPLPPAVPVGELLDVVDRTVCAPTGPARDAIVIRHPLQPFDERNFAPGAVVRDRRWSFDATALAGARALTSERRPPSPFLSEPLPARSTPVIELDDLVRFAERPVRAFLRQRLGVSVGEFADEIEDALPVELGGLESWKVGQRLLDARLGGADPRAAILAEIARGTLPPGDLGRPVIARIHPVVDAIAHHAPAGEATSVDVRVALEGGRVLTGTVPGLAGGVLRTVTYSRVSPRQRLAAWVRLLALTAAHPGGTFAAVTVGRAASPGRAEVTVARVPPLDATDARAYLHVLLDLYDRGMREPPPLACLTSAAYAAAARAGGDAEAAGRKAWESAFRHDGEDKEPEHQLAFGATVQFADLLSAAARPDEQGEWWDPGEPRRFGRWARRLWDPLLGLEEVQNH